MRIALVISVAGISAALSGCAAPGVNASRTSQVATTNCVGVDDADQQVASLLAPGNVQRVEPLFRQATVMQGRPSQDLAGAAMYVPAPAVGSSAYLERALSCHAAGRVATSARANDPLRVAGVVDVDVSEAGSELRIAIRATDRTAARDVLARAKATQEAGGHVQVQQLAQADAANAF